MYYYIANPSIIGDIALKYNFNKQALHLYRLSYDKTQDYDTLIKINSCYYLLGDESLALYTFEKLIENEDINKLKDNDIINEIRYSYMISMYQVGDKASFYKYYNENITKFNNPYGIDFRVITDIERDKNSTMGDYKFALNIGEKLLTKTYYREDLSLLSYVIDLCKKTDDENLQQKYQTIADRISKEVVARHYLMNNNQNLLAIGTISEVLSNNSIRLNVKKTIENHYAIGKTEYELLTDKKPPFDVIVNSITYYGNKDIPQKGDYVAISLKYVNDNIYEELWGAYKLNSLDLNNLKIIVDEDFIPKYKLIVIETLLKTEGKEGLIDIQDHQVLIVKNKKVNIIYDGKKDTL